MALKHGWYCRFDSASREILSCEKDAPDADVDIIRAYAAMRLEGDQGPTTLETIRQKVRLPYRFDLSGIARSMPDRKLD